MTENPKPTLEVLVRQVCALVSATAEVICEHKNDDVLETEAYLYALLAKNCADKHKLREALARKAGQMKVDSPWSKGAHVASAPSTDTQSLSPRQRRMVRLV
jgi:hypothetical protein